MKKLFVLIFAVCFLNSSHAQEFLYGIKTGLTFSQIKGPSESAGGGEVESWTSGTGFQIGALFTYEINDRFGINAELLFNQKGGNYLYDGPSYFIFRDATNTDVAQGNRRVVLSIVNSYIDIPLMVFTRVGPIELSAGGYVSFLTSSKGDGELIISGPGITGTSPDQFISTLDYNYNKDKFNGDSESDFNQNLTVRYNGRNYAVPRVLNAYNELQKDGQRFNGFDAGVSFGASLTFGRGLMLGLRANFGVVDVTDDDLDVTLCCSNGSTNTFNADDDKNRSIDVTLGFRF